MTPYLDLAEHVAETLDIGPGTRVFEVDCGDGAFLYPFHQNGYLVGGIDRDAAMIERARAAMPDGLFTVAAASELDPAVPWDVVLCRLRSAAPGPEASTIPAATADSRRGLVARMCAKATHAVALLNVPEEQHQPLLHALAEVGARAIQIDGTSLFARV